MPRFALILEYHGRPFAGWQRQKGPETVQSALEAALRRLQPDAPGVAAAGRTDAGVHATFQVAHCDLVRAWDPFRLAEALNHHLRPHPIAVLQAVAVPQEFHARFSAVARQYRYRIVERRARLTHEAGLAWRLGHMLDLRAMQAAAPALVGRHDFTTFRSSMCQADSPVRTLDCLEISAADRPFGREIAFRLKARSFLHNQVRSIVGSLERVGAGAWSRERLAEALAARSRAACGPVAPPDGLTLTGVVYPDEFGLPPPFNDAAAL
ncbi:MAG: tRNA pseudouridine(38-40) synthase TruA [Pseudomonadota bacterium]